MSYFGEAAQILPQPGVRPPAAWCPTTLLFLHSTHYIQNYCQVCLFSWAANSLRADGMFLGLIIAFQATRDVTCCWHPCSLNICWRKQWIICQVYFKILFWAFQNHLEANTLWTKIFSLKLALSERRDLFLSLKFSLSILSHNIFLQSTEKYLGFLLLYK